jgi:hypothetical protein
VRRPLLALFLLAPALGLVGIAVADARRGNSSAVRSPAVHAPATTRGNVYRLGAYGGQALKVGDIVTQMEKQPDGSCKSNGPVGVSGSDEPGVGGSVVLETDGDCTVRVKEITSEVPAETRAPGGEFRYEDGTVVKE